MKLSSTTRATSLLAHLQPSDVPKINYQDWGRSPDPNSTLWPDAQWPWITRQSHCANRSSIRVEKLKRTKSMLHVALTVVPSLPTLLIEPSWAPASDLQHPAAAPGEHTAFGYTFPPHSLPRKYLRGISETSSEAVSNRQAVLSGKVYS